MYFEIEKQAIDAINKALDQYDVEIDRNFKLEFPPNPKLGDLASTIAFELTKKLRTSPPEVAKDLVEKWMADNADGPAPVIINISDGVPYYDGKDPRDCMRETVALANDIKSLSNNDGNVLIFNAQIDNVPTTVFPAERNELAQEAAQFLFDITSEVPESYKAAAAKNELPTKEGCRGCIFGADSVQLIQLIDFGSSKGQGDKGLV